MEKIPIANPLLPFLEKQGVVILDGGLATELERHGENLQDDLWSARLLLENPSLIRRVHLDYLKSGADCLVTSSYQATPQGFQQKGLSESQAREALLLSVHLAVQARSRFWADPTSRTGRLEPLVAASIGPYGAYLADGSEYTGVYDLDGQALEAFHRARWEILAESGADLLACETLPSKSEAQALHRLLLHTPNVPAWFSFSCRDGKHLCDGSSLEAILGELAETDQVVALGVNCTAPEFIPQLLEVANKVTEKPLIVYPNSGEHFDPLAKNWSPAAQRIEFGAASRTWHELGARLIGGCCRTGPADIRSIREQLVTGSSAG